MKITHLCAGETDDPQTRPPTSSCSRLADQGRLCASSFLSFPIHSHLTRVYSHLTEVRFVLLSHPSYPYYLTSLPPNSTLALTPAFTLPASIFGFFEKKIKSQIITEHVKSAGAVFLGLRATEAWWSRVSWTRYSGRCLFRTMSRSGTSSFGLRIL